jgi:hypothetical protein
VLGLQIVSDVVKQILSLAKGEDHLRCPSSLLFDGYHNCFGGVKKLESDVDLSCAPNAKFKKEWSSTFPPSVCLHGLCMENCTFYDIQVLFQGVYLMM